MHEGRVAHVGSDALGSALPHPLPGIDHGSPLADVLESLLLLDGLSDLTVPRVQGRREVLGAQIDGGLLVDVLLLLLFGLFYLRAHHDHPQLLLHHEVVLLHEILLLGATLRGLGGLLDVLHLIAQLVRALGLFQVPEGSIEHLFVLGLVPECGEIGLLEFLLGLPAKLLLPVVPLHLPLLVLQH